MKNSNQLLKPASLEDIDAIISIQNLDGYTHSYPLERERIEKLITKGEKFYLLLDNDTPIGMASINIDVRVKLHFFSVIEKLQRKGFGTLMLNHLLNELKKEKTMHGVIYCYSETEAPLTAFLKQNNFYEVGYYKNRYRNGKDAVILEREL